MAKIYRNTCKYCGKKYVKEGNTKYCSRECWVKDIPRVRTGEIHKRPKGGRIIDYNGYVHLRIPEHPNAVRGYVPEHRVVMEKYLGRYLNKKELVHHKNATRNDNRLENLEIVTQKTHLGKIICPHCLKEFLLK